MRTPHLLASACTASDLEARYDRAELAVWEELMRGLAEFLPIWGSPEEGAMVLGEEVDELWDEIRGNHVGCGRAEAAQVGAMALRFIADLYVSTGSGRERCRTTAGEEHDVRVLTAPRGRLFSSSHEGFGFLKCVYDALWSAICVGEPARVVAARVAAMAVRFIAEITSVSVAVVAMV